MQVKIKLSDEGIFKNCIITFLNVISVKKVKKCYQIETTEKKWLFNKNDILEINLKL